MRVVMFIIEVILALFGLMLLVLFKEKEGKKAQGTILLLGGVVLLVLGSDLGDRVKNFKLGESGLEMAFTPQPASLTPKQVAGAQRAQQIKLAPQQSAASSTASNASVASLFEELKRMQQAQTEALHQALASQGFTPAPDPTTDLSPGTVVRIGQDGSVTAQFGREEAFPQLKLRSSNLDFVQFTSLGTKKGFTQFVGSGFHCEQGFREDMDLACFCLSGCFSKPKSIV
jgi:hypothetical protein